MKCPNIQDDKRSHRKYAYLVSSLNSALKYATIDWFLVFLSAQNMLLFFCKCFLLNGRHMPYGSCMVLKFNHKNGS